MSTFLPITKSLAPSMPDAFFDAIPVPKNKYHDSFYVFSLHKCASTMLQRMFRDIGSYNRMTNVAIDQFRFSANYTYTAENLEELPSIFVPKGYWYGVFRRIALDTAPEFHTFDFTKKSILLVRDPRDILTSYYYSIAYSHLAPGDSGKTLRELGKEATPLSIDQYVVNLAPEFLSRFRKYIELLLPNPLCEVFRYEDIIDHKLEFIQAAVKHFHLSFPEQMARTLATKEDIKPVKENVYEHIRRVTPGDHKEKLKPETIDRLNAIFSEVLQRFRYEA